MARLCLLLLLLLAMISCIDDDRESISPEDLESEIIEMNWYSTVKDFYAPEFFDVESSLVAPHTLQEPQRRIDTAIQ
ncbi:MAG: hypothetical protein WDO15_10005 [Bacteroidota bacterium]